jgi:hypothetical protein
MGGGDPGVAFPQPANHPAAALAIRDVLLDSSETVLADQRRGELTQAFRDVVDYHGLIPFG